MSAWVRSSHPKTSQNGDAPSSSTVEGEPSRPRRERTSTSIGIRTSCYATPPIQFPFDDRPTSPVAVACSYDERRKIPSPKTSHSSTFLSTRPPANSEIRRNTIVQKLFLAKELTSPRHRASPSDLGDYVISPRSNAPDLVDLDSANPDKVTSTTTTACVSPPNDDIVINVVTAVLHRRNASESVSSVGSFGSTTFSSGSNSSNNTPRSFFTSSGSSSTSASTSVQSGTGIHFVIGNIASEHIGMVDISNPPLTDRSITSITEESDDLRSSTGGGFLINTDTSVASDGEWADDDLQTPRTTESTPLTSPRMPASPSLLSKSVSLDELPINSSKGNSNSPTTIVRCNSDDATSVATTLAPYNLAIPSLATRLQKSESACSIGTDSDKEDDTKVSIFNDYGDANSDSSMNSKEFSKWKASVKRKNSRGSESRSSFRTSPNSSTSSFVASASSSSSSFVASTSNSSTNLLTSSFGVRRSSAEISEMTQAGNGNGSSSTREIDDEVCEGNCFVAGEDMKLSVSDTGVIKLRAASPERLVRRLLCDKHNDIDFTNAFLLTYRMFIDASRFFLILQQRYLETTNNVVRLRVCAVLKQWIERYYNDFLPQQQSSDNDNNATATATSSADVDVDTLDYDVLIYRVSRFLDIVQIDYPSSAANLKRVVEKRGVFVANPINTIAPPLPNRSRGKNKGFLDFDDLEVARQLTLMEFEWFAQIHPTEFMNQAWILQKRTAPNIANMIKRSNKIPFWVATEIMQRDVVDERVALLRKFIGIADHCKSLSNYNGLMEILSGLNMTAVHRLKKTWGALSPRVLNVFLCLNEFMSADSNFKTYRESLKKETQARLPYLGRYLTDLVFAEDASPLMLTNGLVHVSKCRSIATLIFDACSHQKQSYIFQAVPEIQAYLDQAEGLTEKALLKLSRKLEPKTP